MKPSVVLLFCSIGCLLTTWAATHVQSSEKSPQDSKPIVPPDIALLYSGNLQGVLEPCGCQIGHSGGLARRATLLASVLKMKSGLAAIDSGNLVASLSPSKAMLIEACAILEKMGYEAGVLGPSELGLGTTLVRSAASESALPLVLSNIAGSDGRPISTASHSFVIGPYKARLFCTMGESRIPSGFTFTDPLESLKDAVRDANAQDRINILVAYQSAREARALAAALPEIDYIIVHAPEFVKQESVGQTWLLPAPSSGEYLLSAGIAPRRKFSRQIDVLRFEVSLSLGADEEVSRQVSRFYEKNRLPIPNRESYLSVTAKKQVQDAIQAAARSCGQCHPKEQKQWSESGHAHAWATLSERGQQSRPECISCHTTPLLVAPLGRTEGGVGCASCHGDGFEHSTNPRAKGLITRSPSEKDCRTCHSTEASPRFVMERYIKSVRH
jgi:2',3'-cyclic-nucleotide 2'-phosphodiesterase (5'-nucleotidase family)